MVRTPAREVASREVWIVDQRSIGRVGVDALFRSRVNRIQQRLPTRIDQVEIAAEGAGDDVGVAALVVPRHRRVEGVEVGGERADRVVVIGLLRGDAVGGGLRIDAGLFGRDHVVFLDHAGLFGGRQHAVAGPLGELRIGGRGVERGLIHFGLDVRQLGRHARLVAYRVAGALRRHAADVAGVEGTYPRHVRARLHAVDVHRQPGDLVAQALPVAVV